MAIFELDHGKNLIESLDCPEIRHSEKHYSHGPEHEIRLPLKQSNSVHVRVIFAKKGDDQSKDTEVERRALTWRTQQSPSNQLKDV
jgi:hypothetical protein